jgi:hypothetical protein
MKQHRAIRIIAATLAVVLCVVSVRYQWAVAVATVVLLYITFEYLLTTRDSLDLLRSEARRRETILPYFDLALKDRDVSLRVSNLGLSNFLLQTVDVRKPDKADLHYDMHRVVESGKTERILFPESLLKSESLSVDLEIAFQYVGLEGANKVGPKCFSISLDLNDRPYAIMEGLDDTWWVQCPKCRAPAGTNIQGITTFEAAEDRRRKLTEDLSNSCPDHTGEFLLTVEDVRAQQQAKKGQHRESLS